MTAPVEPAPANLRNGRTLTIPQNVWFVGTANHDETTKDFADKTYDRAHVMELPRNRAQFQPQRLPARAPGSLSSRMGGGISLGPPRPFPAFVDLPLPPFALPPSPIARIQDRFRRGHQSIVFPSES